MEPSQTGKPKFDPITLLGQVFAYVKHVRLMILMGALGLCAGLVYFLFSIPTYRATSLVSVQGFGAPVSNVAVSETAAVGSFNRSFLTRFRSQRVRVAAAAKLGLIPEKATFEAVIPHVPNVTVVPLDNRSMEVTILAYDPEVVRNYTKAMVEEFQRIQEEDWEQYRDEALQRYSEQIAQLEDKIAESIEALTKVEREQNLTEVTLEQRSLLEIPKDLVRTKAKLTEMAQIQDILQRIEQEEQTENTTQNSEERITGYVLRLLSLLGDFEKDTVVDVGDVISTTGPRSGIVASSKAAEVVVEPSRVDGIEPWRELERKLRMLETQITEASKIYRSEHQVMKDLLAEQQETRRALQTELDVLLSKFDLEYAKLQEQQKMLESRMPDYLEVTEKLGKSAFAYSSIAEQQKMWDQAREALSKKLATISFSEDFDWVQVRYNGHVSLRDEVPVSPSKSKLAMLSLMVALAGAFGLPTLLNLFNTSASTVQQLEEHTGLKGIGIVPLTSKDLLEDVHRSPAQGATVPNFLLEAFRIIRSNICLTPNRHERSQVVLVTSSRPQEGKTTLAANLAWAFHSMGEKTLLLDCDLRRGRVHGLIGIDNSPGMTRLLMGECSPDEAITKFGKNAFDVIPRGPVIAGTTEILCQRPFEQLVELFRKHYDRIVIDSPPTLGLSESSSLQRLVDGTVLVVRAEKTSRKDVTDAIALLNKSDAHFFGFVLNAIDLSKVSNYYYYYYYSAPYYDQLGASEEAENQAEYDSQPQLRQASKMLPPTRARGAEPASKV